MNEPKAVVDFFDGVDEKDRVYFVGSSLKNPLTYTVDEEITFKLRVKSKQGYIDVPYVAYTLEGDDQKRSEGFAEPSEDGWFYISTSLARDGFVHLTANACDQNKEIIKRVEVFEGGAGADIDKIECAAEVPEDYFAFWDWLKGEVDKCEPEVLYEEEFFPEGIGNFRVFDMRIKMDDTHYVSLVYSYPKDAEEGSLKMYMYLPGYGRGSASPMYWDDKLTVVVNGHSILNRQPPEYYQRLTENELRAYGFNDEENKDPKTTYWAKMLMRDLQAVKYFKNHPLFNKKDITFSGGSQGAMRACNLSVHSGVATACSLNIPWMCDLAAHEKHHRLNGWRPKYQDGLRYFDTAVAARYLTCPVDVVAGLGDYICPPSGVYAMYKQIKAPKKMRFIQNKSHSSVIPEREIYDVD